MISSHPQQLPSEYIFLISVAIPHAMHLSMRCSVVNAALSSTHCIINKKFWHIQKNFGHNLLNPRLPLIYINMPSSSLVPIKTELLRNSIIAIFATMSDKLCLQWNDFKDVFSTAFGNLRSDTYFIDVTLACEDGQHLKAHKGTCQKRFSGFCPLRGYPPLPP